MQIAGWAPHLDLQALEQDDLVRVQPLLGRHWPASGVESHALRHAAASAGWPRPTTTKRANTASGKRSGCRA